MYRVLLVDDEPAVLEGLNLMIDWEHYGFQKPSCAFDCDEAISRMEENRYHLVITDIRMPGMSGLELLSELQHSNAGVKTLILSGYDEFDYAKKAIGYGVKGYLLKPVDRMELAGYLETIRAELDSEAENKAGRRKFRLMARETFFFDLVCGRLTDREIRNGVSEFGFALSQSGYCVALCQIRNFLDILADSVTEAGRVQSTIRNLVEEILLDKHLGYVYGDTDGLLGMILCTDKGALTVDRIDRCLRAIGDMVSRELNIDLLIGYGNLVEDVSALLQSRKNAFCALERHFMAAGSCVSSYAQVVTAGNSLWHIRWSSQPLLDAVECGDLAQARAQVESFTRELAEHSVPRDAVSNLVFSIIFGLCSVIRRSGGDPGQIFSYAEEQAALARPYGRDELTDWIFGLCEKTAAYIRQLAGTNKAGKLIGQVRQYIDENFTRKNISVKEISQIFYINAAYLGQLFKNTVGETISDYVNKKKIAEVKKMVFLGNMPIHDALDKAGYHDPGYFYKKFKQYEGVSFAEYNRPRGPSGA